MKCPRGKQWVLFYYDELGQRNKERLTKHLKECPRCRQDYSKISGLLGSAGGSEITLPEEELRGMVLRAKQSAPRHLGFTKRLTEKAGLLLDNFYAGLGIFTPRAALSAIAILILTVLVFTGYRKQEAFNRQLSEFQIELAHEDEFDIFLDIYEFRSQSLKPSSSVISS